MTLMMNIPFTFALFLSISNLGFSYFTVIIASAVWVNYVMEREESASNAFVKFQEI